MNLVIIIFAYNRPKYLKRMLVSFNKCYKINVPIHAFIDQSPLQDEIRRIFYYSNSDVIVHQRNNHYGCRNNIRFGISEMFETYNALIVLEDDLVFSKDCLTYLKDQLEINRFNKNIGAISCRNYSGEYSCRFISSAWATWRDRWQKINWDMLPLTPSEKAHFYSIGWDLPVIYENTRTGKSNSWAISFCWHHAKNALLCMCPKKSKVKHIGRKGTNFHFLSFFRVISFLKQYLWNFKYSWEKDFHPFYKEK